MRIEMNRETTLHLYVDDEDGALVDVTGPDPVPTATLGSGGTILLPAVEHPDVGHYTVTVPGQVHLDEITVTWAYSVGTNARVTTQHLTVIAERLITVRELRGDEKIMARDPSPDTAWLNGLVQTVEDWFCRAMRVPYCEQSFTRTFTIKKNSQVLLIPTVIYPRSVTAVTVNDQVFTQDEVADIRVDKFGVERGVSGWSFLTGASAGSGGWSPGRYTISGTFGANPDLPYIPADLRRAAMTMARYANRTNNYSERARQVQTQDAVMTFSMPSPDRPTGLPEVDAVVTGYGHRPVV